MPKLPNRRTPRDLRAGLTLAAVSAVVTLGAAAAYARDTNRAQAFVVGASPGIANGEGLDACNTNRTRGHFPRAPQVALRIRVPGGIGQAPASDSAGNLLLVHGEPQVSKLDSQGRTLWTVRLESEAASAPVLTADGDILVISQEADALLLAPSGKLRHEHRLPLAEPRHRTLAIPTANGGALVASGKDLVELSESAEVVRQTRTRANLTAIAESAFGLLAIGENGAVALAHATGDFEPIGSLGGAVADGAAVQGGRLFAVVDGHKLVALDLKTGSALTLASDPAVGLSGPPTLFENQSSVVVADGGFLSLHAPSGGETLRVSIAEAARAFDPALRALRPALTIGDAAGDVAASRSGSDAIVLQADGKAQRMDDTSCLDPFRPTPTLHGIVFACRSGQLFWVSDKAP